MNLKNTSIAGIILSGGKSSRMGIDKGLLDFQEKKLIQYPIDLLAPFCKEIIISTNQKGYEFLGLKLVADEYPDCGPMGGIHAGLKSSGSDWNLIVSCDTPFLNAKLIQKLVQNRDQYEAVIPIHKGGVEPLAALYHKNLVKFFNENILSKNLKLQDIIRERKVNFLHVDDLLLEYPQMFQNFNSKTDFYGFQNL